MAFFNDWVRKDSLNWCVCVGCGELVALYELRFPKPHEAGKPQQFSGILAIAGPLAALRLQR